MRIPPIVTLSDTTRYGQPLSLPIVPGSSVRKRLDQNPSSREDVPLVVLNRPTQMTIAASTTSAIVATPRRLIRVRVPDAR